MRFLIFTTLFLLTTQSVAAAEPPEDRLTRRTAVHTTPIERAAATGSLEAPPGKANRLVVYSATWCAACQRLTPVIESLKKEGYQVVYLSVDKDAAKLKYPYRAIPTIYFLSGEEVIKKEVGYRSGQQIKQTLVLQPRQRPIQTVAHAHWN